MNDDHRLLWIAAYPKSGSTWLRMFVAHMLAPAQAATESLNAAAARVPVDFGQIGFDRALGVKLVDLTSDEALMLKPRRLEAEAERQDWPGIIRTHDAFVASPLGEPLLPPHATRGAVHLVRDPRDIAVSYADFFNCSLDEAIVQMADPGHVRRFNPDSDVGPQVPLTLLDWSRHCRSWMEAEAAFPVLRIRYEDLLDHPIATFTRLAQFSGIPTEQGAVAQAVAATSFDRLKARDIREKFSFRGDGASFFRAGRSGGWRTALSAKQARRITDEHGAVMVELGYDLA